jgi:hypothetical protein
MRILVALLPLLAACFDPELRDGVVSCGSDRSCPPDFVCSPVDNLCYRNAPGSGADAAVDADLDGGANADADSDAPPMIDASIDASASPACSDGVDNDCDGLVDSADPGCLNANDVDEHGSSKCDNGMDDDHDGLSDFHVVRVGCSVGDPGCSSPTDTNEN